jgi:hypothetical protein
MLQQLWRQLRQIKPQLRQITLPLLRQNTLQLHNKSLFD